MDKNAIKRCLSYAMLGDAIGFLVEGKPKAEVLRLQKILATPNLHQQTQLFNSFPITDWITQEPYTPGQISDDSQSMLALVKAYSQQEISPQLALAQNLCHLFQTQQMVGYGHTSKDAMDHFHKHQNIETCGDPTRPTNGAAMRVAPLGILFYNNPEILVDECVNQAQITHKHPQAILASIALATAVALAYQKKGDMRQYAQQMRHNFAIYAQKRNINTQHLETSEQILKTWCESQSPQKQKDIILQIDKQLNPKPTFHSEGLSCHAIPSTFMGIYSYLQTQNSTIEACISHAISLGGDTDTTACMAAAIFSTSQSQQHFYTHWIHDRKQKISL